jgi:hypothetical protein
MGAGGLVQVGEQFLTTGQRGLRAEGRCRERRDAAAESRGVWQTLFFRQSDRKARSKRVAGTCRLSFILARFYRSGLTH